MLVNLYYELLVVQFSRAILINGEFSRIIMLSILNGAGPAALPRLRRSKSDEYCSEGLRRK